MKIKLLLFSFFIIATTKLLAQSPFIDTTFNAAGPKKGKKEINSVPSATIKAMAVDAQGRMVVAINDYTLIHIYRISADGVQLDTLAILNYPYNQAALCMAIQGDGKILLGGYRIDVNSYSDMMVMRLNSDHTGLDQNFGNLGVWQQDMGSNDQVSGMAIQSDGKIVLSGVSGLNSAITVLRLNSNGTQDMSFNKSTGIYVSTSVGSEDAKGLDLYNDEIYVGGVNYATSLYALIKLRPNGVADTSFSGDGRLDINVGSTYGTDVKVQRDGRILFSINDDADNFVVHRYFPNANYDTTFGANGIARLLVGFDNAPHLANILIDQDDNLILSGNDSYNFIAMKVNQYGKIDTTFGVHGLISVPAIAYPVIVKSAFTKDQRLIMAGADQSPYIPTLIKLNTRNVVHVLGKSYVLPESGEVYTVDAPASWPNNYTWTYTGQNLFMPVNTGKSIFVYFTDSTTAGDLICTINLANPISMRLPITINKNSTDAGQLAALQCTPGISDCGFNYIQSFKFNNLKNDASACSSAGYSDFTASKMVDTLSTGGVYSASMLVKGAPGNFHVGMWIDYNNDGSFNSSDEFVVQKTINAPSTQPLIETYIEVHNIILKIEEGYDGPKRLRVRCRQDAAFTSGESCQVNNEFGETEDYMIVIEAQKVPEAPQIFTPNDDGKNDFFVIRGIDPVKNNHLTVFDRWGTEKFTADNYKNNWNGNDTDGKKLSPGTYYYVFTINDQTIRGFLELRY